MLKLYTMTITTYYILYRIWIWYTFETCNIILLYRIPKNYQCFLMTENYWCTSFLFSKYVTVSHCTLQIAVALVILVLSWAMFYDSVVSWVSLWFPPIRHTKTSNPYESHCTAEVCLKRHKLIAQCKVYFFLFSCCR